MDNTDPFAVIAEEAPAFSDEEAIAIAAARYGWQVTVRSLVSERDQNFRLALGDGRKFVLKIANAAEDPQVTDFQIQALLHIAKRARAAHLAVIAPEIVPTLEGDVSFTLEKDGRQHVVRAVTWLEGVPLAAQQASPVLARDAGERLAELGRTLEGFDHPGSRHSLLWDIQQALSLRRLLHHVRDAGVARAVEGALDDYEQHVAPAMVALRSQVIHSDLNPDNMLIAADKPDKLVGVI
ncbi:MAG: phosphotransferase, partial [Woeseiaceae bacterium]|nr:phosphotransferase [Woeseiaceae bacterium]